MVGKFTEVCNILYLSVVVYKHFIEKIIIFLNKYVEFFVHSKFLDGISKISAKNLLDWTLIT